MDLGNNSVGVGAWSATCALFVGIIVYVMSQKMKGALDGVRRILLATTVFLSADVLLGSHLELSGIFGSSPLLGARYHGLGNPASELLIVASILWCGLHVQRSNHRLDAVWTAAALLLVVTIVIGAPGLGSDVGGLLTMVVTSIGLLAALAVGRLSWKWLIGAAATAVGAVVVAAVIDYQRAPASRTHLGRLLARVINEGPAPLVDTISRKVNANVLGYGFPWSLAVIGVAGFMLIGLLRGQWAFTLPLGSPQRFAVVAALAGSFVGYAVNDSGIVVLALAAVFVGPYVLVEYRFKRSSSKLEVVVS